MKRYRNSLSLALVGLLTVFSALGLTAQGAVAGGGGLSWPKPAQVLTLEGGTPLIWGSNLAVDGGSEYWVYADSSATPWLATDVGGAWKNYSLGVQSLEHSGATTPLGSIAVQGGVVYIPYLDGASGSLDLAYNPSGSPSGPWVQATVVPANTSGALCGLGTETYNPSAAIAGGTLYVSFDDGAPCDVPGTGQVYLASVALSALPQASGGSAPWDIVNVTSASGDSLAPAIASDGQTASLAWDTNGGTLNFQGDIGSPQVQTVFTAPDDFYNTTQMAMGQGSLSGVDVIALYAGGTNNNGNYAATDAGGSWSEFQLGGASPGGPDRPAAAVSSCGPAVAYDLDPAPGSYGGTVDVATFSAGQWTPVTVGSTQVNTPQVPALAAIPSGYDLLYVNNDGSSPQLYASSTTCGPVVTAVTPTSGPPAGGTTVTIRGYGFTGATAVDVQGSVALGNPGYGPIAATDVQVVSATEITAVVPPGSGTVDVTVVTPEGTSPTRPADEFQYAASTQGGGAASFTDLSGYSYAAQAIEALAAQGIIKGTGPTTFDPGGKITRAQFALLMERTFNLPAPAQPITFHDVSQSSVAYSAIEAVAPYMDYYQNPGGGYNFQPKQYVDRLGAATVMVKMLAASGKLSILSMAAAQAVLAHVTDASTIAPALQPYAATALQAGLMAGYSDGTFRPQVVLVRAQVAVLIWRLENQFLTTGSAAP